MNPSQDSLELPITKAAQRSCIVAIVMTILSLSFVGLKVVTRARVQGRLGWDDALVSLSFLLTIPFAVTIFGQAENGEGRAMREISFPMLGRQLKWLWVSILLYSLGTGLAKLSILCQYLRVFIDRRTTIATWVTIVFVAAYTVEATALGVFSCVPVAKYWQRQLPGHCMDRPIYYYFNAAMNMLINIIIIIIPIPRLLRLNISNHSKWGMIIAFSFGFVGCIMSAIRLYTIARVSYSNDKSVTSPGPATWTAVELHVSIVCACLPSLRPLLGRIFTLGLLEPTTELASSSSPDDTYSGATHKRTLPSIAWSKAHAHASRLPSVSSTSEGKRGFGGDVVEVRSLGDGDGGVRTGGRGRSVELSELEHGIIKVTSTSEVYSSPAVDQDGNGGGAVCGRSSGESESRLTRPGVDQWGYSCEVSVEKDRQYGAS